MFCLKPKGVAHSLFQEAPTLILCGYSGLERWEILVHTSHKSHRTRSKHAGRISCKQSTETGLLLPFVGGLVQTVSSAFVKPVKQLKKPEAIFSLVRLYSTGRTAVRNFEFRSTYAFITNGKHQPTVLWHQDIGDKGSRWSEHLESPSFPNLPSTPGPGFCRPCVARAIKRRHQGNNLSNLGPVRLKLKWIQRASPEDQAESSLKPTINMDRLVEFLYDDLPHLFDDQGIDRTAYDDCVKFRDPITKHDTLSGYLFNIAFLKTAFQPMFYLHSVKQTGPYDITTRWTMVMKFMPLPWKPELIFTGTSVMGINPATGKFCSHVDYWDSIQNNEYFSLEGLLDVFKQLRIYKTPYLETPKYQILKRTSNYEVRRYEPFIVVETDGDKLSGSKGFNDVAGYIFGKNSTQEKIPMTTPVFTQALDNKLSKVAIQIVLPLEKDMNNLPDPSQERISLRKVQGGMAAVLKFSGNPSEDVVLEKEMKLRKSLESDGLRPKIGCLLARYNDPGRTWSFMLRNEVLIWLEEFELC